MAPPEIREKGQMAECRDYSRNNSKVRRKSGFLLHVQEIVDGRDSARTGHHRLYTDC